jgi:hypothetical protein
MALSKPRDSAAEAAPTVMEAQERGGGGLAPRSFAAHAEALALLLSTEAPEQLLLSRTERDRSEKTWQRQPLER